MKEHPILFSAPMILALLSGSKTQTRRAVKLPHANPLGEWQPCTSGGAGSRTRAGESVAEHPVIWHTRTGDTIPCPHGAVGDRLWVRERWKSHSTFEHLPPRDLPESKVFYGADSGYSPDASRWRSSIHMPRWASRITLEIVGVRVQRLQDISGDDCWAEGIEELDGSLDDADIYAAAKRLGETAHDPRPTFCVLWESIHGPGSWDANPWVWAISFRRAP